MRTMMNAAQTKLHALLHEIQSQSPKTLAYWRLSNPRMMEALISFAASGAITQPSAFSQDNHGNKDEPLSPESLLQETQTLFDTINPILAEQEAAADASFRAVVKESSSSAYSSSHQASLISVVFGGKYSPTPRSISELLVSKLAVSCSRVITVSRTPQQQQKILADGSTTSIVSSLPDNVTHVPKQHLDQPCENKGTQEFSEVLQLALSEWKNNSTTTGGATLHHRGDDNDDETTTTNTDCGLVIYFTLGQHKGENPFVRNLQAARNFADALLEPTTASVLTAAAAAASSSKNHDLSQKWKVVLTGTDATLPSTHPDGSIDGLLVKEMIVEDAHDDGGVEAESTTTTTITCTVPTYKIMKYNYTYAMSKLGQYYIIASAIAKITGNDALVMECEPIIDKIQRHVEAAGEDEAYHPDTAIVSMEELDAISAQVDGSLLSLQEDEEEEGVNSPRFFTIAQGISICYTPLHARPWAEQAWKSAPTDRAAQRAYILEQAVKRFKNAISIEQAVASHCSF